MQCQELVQDKKGNNKETPRSKLIVVILGKITEIAR